MLWTLVTVLLLLWLFGIVVDFTLGGFVHVLLLLALVVLSSRWIGGRRTVTPAPR